MAFYNSNREGATPIAAEVLLALTSSATSVDRIVEVFIGGEATASTVNRMTARRSSAVGTTPSAQTPEKLNPRSAAAAATVATTFSAEPTTVAVALGTWAFNAFGGVIRWVAAPGEELYVVGGTAADTEISIESTSGTGLISLDMKFEEL